MHVQQYVENDVVDKSPVELIRLLYSKAIEKVRQAIRHTAGEDIRERSHCVTHVMEIVAELQGALNVEAGGELAVELAKLYDYIQQRLIEAAGEPAGTTQLDEVGLLLGNLCEGWNHCEPPPRPLEQMEGSSTGNVAAEAEQTSARNGRSAADDFPIEEVPSRFRPADYGSGGESRVWTL